jgi:uncharacterized protein YbcI
MEALGRYAAPETSQPDHAMGPDANGSISASISNGIVQAMKHHAGKGPMKAKTYVLDSCVIVVTRDPLTTADRTLLAAGQVEAVRGTRRLLHQQAVPPVRAHIEELTGRRILGSESQMIFDADTETHVFVLAPGDP